MTFLKNIKVFILSVLCCLSAQMMQSQSISVGGGFEYNMSIDEVGYHLRAYYNIGEHICFGPEFTTFGDKRIVEDGVDIDESSVEYNLNGHYIFELSHKIGTYPILGLNHTRIKEEYIEPTTNEPVQKNINTWAANLGWGTHYNLKNGSIFFEYHTSISTPGDHILSLGAFFNFGNSGEEDTHEVSFN